MTDVTSFAEGALLLEREGGIARIVFNRPERMNAMTFASWSALADVAAMLAEDDTLRVVSVEGAGERAFVSGADITEFEDIRSRPDTAAAYDRAVHDALNALSSLPVPSVALIRGYCIGGGLEIALSCDMRIAASDAQFAITPAKLGLGFGYDGVTLITRNTGAAVAADLLFSARRVDAGLTYRAFVMEQGAESIPHTAAKQRLDIHAKSNLLRIDVL